MGVLVQGPLQPAGRNVKVDNLVKVDVREDIRERRDPFAKIMRVVADLQAGQRLLLVAPFKPVPLLEVITARLRLQPKANWFGDRAGAFHTFNRSPNRSRPSGRFVVSLSPAASGSLSSMRRARTSAALSKDSGSVGDFAEWCETRAGRIISPAPLRPSGREELHRRNGGNNPMVVSLPISAPVNFSRSIAGPGQAGRRAPSVRLPLAFILVGLLALFVGAGWLLAEPTLLSTYHYNQHVIAVTHLLVLGWICSVVMGATTNSCRCH